MKNHLIKQGLKSIEESAIILKDLLDSFRLNGEKLTKEQCISVAESQIKLMDAAQKLQNSIINDEVKESAGGLSFNVEFDLRLFLGYLGYVQELKQLLPMDKKGDELQSALDALGIPKELKERFDSFRKKIKGIGTFNDWFVDKLIAEYRDANLDLSKAPKDILRALKELEDAGYKY